MQSSSARPLPFRLRPELEIRPLTYQQRRCWVVRDPVGLKHYFLTDQEHDVLGMLDGKASPAEVQQQYAARYAPQRLGGAQLQSFLVRLQREGLLLSDPSAAAATQLRRAERQRGVWRRPAYWLSYRLPLLNPDRVVRVLARGLGWLFRWPGVTAALLSGIAIAVWIGLPATLTARGAEAVQAMLGGENMLPMAIALLLVRVLHEWGHALACRVAGRPCVEMGITLLMGMPVLYCDVSAAWTLNNKWRRMAISAAGMYVEWLAAAVCLALWSASKPGLLHSVSLNIVLVCTVGTLLLNGNPLMRYDGYYLLADWLEIPNLDQVGRSALKRRMWSFFFGVAPAREHLVDPRRERLCAVYAAAASVYRTALLLALLGFAYYLLEPLRLEALVVLLGSILGMTMLGERLVATWRELSDRQAMRQLHWKRFVVLSSLIALLTALALVVPLPHRVRAPAVFEPRAAQPLYVTAPGRIRSAAVAGQRVAGGEIVVQLENPELRLLELELATERERLDQRLRALEARRGFDPRAAAQIPTTREARDDFSQRRARAAEEVQRLTIRADRAGTLLAPSARPPDTGRDGQLDVWSGTPLDPHNRGAWLESGTRVATLAHSSELVAVAVVEQHELPHVAVGQQVQLRLVADPRRVHRGRIVEVARKPLDEAPPELAASGEVLLAAGAGANEPLVPSYQVRIEMSEAVPATPGARARCRILAPRRSCAQRLYTFLRRTFSKS